jgi:hypothetical protein
MLPKSSIPLTEPLPRNGNPVLLVAYLLERFYQSRCLAIAVYSDSNIPAFRQHVSIHITLVHLASSCSHFRHDIKNMILRDNRVVLAELSYGLRIISIKLFGACVSCYCKVVIPYKANTDNYVE